MSIDETRVVVVKPGDVVLLGNLGLDQEQLDVLRPAVNAVLGERWLAFAGDINLGLLDADDLASLIEERTAAKEINT